MSTLASKKKQVLIVANALVPGGPPAFPPEIRTLMSETSEALIIAPTLTSKLQWYASDIDRAHGRAKNRLESILADAAVVDHEVLGMVGDEDQLLAIADALRSFNADAIVLVVNAVGERNHKERHLIRHVERRFHLPVLACSVAEDGSVSTI